MGETSGQPPKNAFGNGGRLRGDIKRGSIQDQGRKLMVPFKRIHRRIFITQLTV